MAFAALGGNSAGRGQAETGPELTDIYSEKFAFKPVNKDTKLKLLPEPWDVNSPPPSTSSLLSINNKHGLLAVGGPNGVAVSRTSSVHDAFQAEEGGEYRSVQPDLFLPLGTRISHVAFSSDGASLVVSAEQGGGLAVFSTEQILQGNTNPSKEIGTNGTSLRALVANPASESAELFAVVTVKGELYVIDLKAGNPRSGPNGECYKSGVSCVSWSIKGKALLVGLADGTVSQLMADGSATSDIPRPPTLPQDHHVAGIEWLSVDLAIIAYSPDNFNPQGFPPSDPSQFFVMERIGPKNGPKSHRFSPLPELCIATGERLPNVFQMLTISKWGTMDYLVITSASASEDVNVVTRSKVPLGEGASTDTFSKTTPTVDALMANLPMTEDKMNSTFPLGMALDLTNTDKVVHPVKGQEDVLEFSLGPLPALTILNTEGLLSAWWIICADPILAGIDVPGLVTSNSQSAPPAASQASNVASNALGAPSPAFGQSSSLGGFAKPAFGMASTPASTKPAFGHATSLGAGPGAASQAGGSSAFGQSSSLGANRPAFGESGFSAKPAATSQLSTTATQSSFTTSSPFAKSASQQSPFAAAGTSAKPFGTPSTFGPPSSSPGSPWGQTPSATTKSAAFAAPANAGTSNASPFNQAASTPTSFNTPSTFGKPAAQASFGSPSTLGATQSTNVSDAFRSSASQGTDKPNPFAKPGDRPFATAFGNNNDSKGLFGPGNTFSSGAALSQGKSPFTTVSGQPNPFATNAKLKLESAFADQASKSSESDKSSKDSGGSLFGSGFDSALPAAAKDIPRSKASDHEETMEDDDGPAQAPVSPDIAQSTTPQETPAAQKTLGAPSIKGGMYGSETQNTETPAASTTAFGRPSFAFPKDPEATPKPDHGKSKELAETQAPAHAPLPPESQSKDAYTPTNSSTTSSVDSSVGAAESAPLPPDPVMSKTKSSAAEEMPPLPPDFTKAAKAVGPSTSVPTGPVKTSALPESKPTAVNPFARPDSKKPESKDPQISKPAEDQSPIDDEGSGVDVANELSTEGSPESSFLSKSPSTSFFQGKGSGSFKQPTPGARSVFDSVARPHVDFFKQPEPSDDTDLPRSPSPVRQPKPSAFARPQPPASKNTASQKKAAIGRPTPPAQTVVKPIASAVQQGVEKNRQAAEAKAKAQQEAEEQELSDQEDELIRAELEAPIEPITSLPGFVAHQDYIGEVSKEGIPGQIEIVYRDANSMVDTLGLNLRAVKGWVKGNEQSGIQGAPDLTDLENADLWTLADIDGALELHEELFDQLDAALVEDVPGKLKICKGLCSELNKLQKRSAEVGKTLEVLKQRNDTDGSEDMGVFSAAQSEAQQDLRRAFSDFRSNLAAAEEGVALLRARLASSSKSHGSNGAPKVPTVEAVERTINKMTSMIEKKCTELDILATQLQKFGFQERPVSSRGLLQGRRSRSGSPFDTPTQSRPGSSAKNASPLRASVNGRSAFLPRNSRLGTSLLAEGIDKLNLGTASGTMALTPEDLQQYTERLRHRKEVNKVLKSALGEGQLRIKPLDDD